MKKTLVLFGALFLVSCTSSSNNDNTLLLVSFDGFRADYLTKTDTPNLDYLVENGVTSEGLIPVYPSVTFANYYAITTGLYPENNGIISNNMYDAEIGERFSLGNREQVENPAWYKGEPIWNTVEKSGKKAGTMFWVGSETKIQDMRPSHWKTYDGDFPDSARVDTVVSWITQEPSKKIDFATLYFSFVDSQGHRFGPDSQEVIDAIKKADDLIGYLIQRLRENNLWDSTNLLVISDHGMTELSRERIIVLDDYINTEDVDIISGSPAVMFNAKEGKADAVYSSLKKNEKNFKVYKKEDIPERFHLKKSDRMPEFLIVVDEGYTLNSRKYFDARPLYPSGGAHGYDNMNEEMWALFIAKGPAFKKGYKAKAFINIHLYTLMAKILNLEPAENDGNLVEVSDILN